MHYTQKPENTDVELALGALDGNPSPMDLPLEGFDASPTNLGLMDGEEGEMSSIPRCTHPDMGDCIICDQSH